MKILFLSTLLFTSTFISTTSFADDDIYLPEKIVNTMEHVFGDHQGQRRNHSKGFCAQGHFIATKEAADLTTSSLFNGENHDAVIRFSIPGGNPDASDTTHAPRGMALHFSLPDGEEHNMTMLNVPVFGAATPETFLADLESKRPNPNTSKIDPQKRKIFFETHPDAIPLKNYMAEHTPPKSYASTNYHSLNAFYVTNAQGKTTPIKWRFDATTPITTLTDNDLKTMPHDFLHQDLIDRMKKGQISWNMMMIIGEDNDPLNNPTIAWPTDRKEIKVGTLNLSTPNPDDTSCNDINYDPLILSDGFEGTNDPILQARSPAYAISVGRRLSE